MGSKEKTILQSVVLWYNNCAKSAVRTDETVRPASRELYRQSTAWKVNAASRFCLSHVQGI